MHNHLHNNLNQPPSISSLTTEKIFLKLFLLFRIIPSSQHQSKYLLGPKSSEKIRIFILVWNIFIQKRLGWPNSQQTTPIFILQNNQFYIAYLVVHKNSSAEWLSHKAAADESSLSHHSYTTIHLHTDPTTLWLSCYSTKNAKQEKSNGQVFIWSHQTEMKGIMETLLEISPLRRWRINKTKRRRSFAQGNSIT